MKRILRQIGIPLLIGILAELVFLLFQARGIYGGDSGDLVTAAFQFGIPHPPGYPLYTFLGWLVSRIPLFTPAWRIALLSSLPHALAVSIVYLLVVEITRSRVAGIFSAVAIAANYVFFLYSVTPEVFAFLDLFITLLTYLLIRWVQTKKAAYLYWAAFVFGLSLSHHHVILFFVPGIAYLVWINRKMFSLRLRLLGYFFIGLLPYLYIPIAARGNAIVNWDRPVDVAGFIRLVTRADYGTFVSGGFYGTQLIQRLLQVKGYIELLFLDLRIIGIALALLGIVFLWRKHKNICIFFLISIFFLGPGFFFYASFPLFNRFNWGTYERFLLPSYMFLYALTGIGLYQLSHWAKAIVPKKFPVLLGLTIVFFLYPVTMFMMTAWRFWGLPLDKTADNLGIDMLQSLPKGAIVLVSRDTPLFTAQYVRYVLEKRSDVILLHANKLALSDYPPVIARIFPDLKIPSQTGASFPTEFIKANRNRPIFTNTLFPVETGWFWVPYGLVYRLTPQEELPAMDIFYENNRKIWNSFHDPTTGILRRYNHLMLSDVRDVYAASRIEFGKTILKAGKLDEAKKELEAALAYGGDTQVSDAYTLLGLTELFSERCTEALAYFTKARENSLAPDKFISLYEGVTYRDCAKDAMRAQELFREYERLKKSEETPLQ